MGSPQGLAAGDAFYGFVHNAGQPYDTLPALIDQDEGRSDHAGQLLGVHADGRGRCVRPMTRARAGRIVGIGSIAALRASQGNGAYAATQGRADRLRTHAGHRNGTAWRDGQLRGARLRRHRDARALRCPAREHRGADPGRPLRTARRGRRRRRLPDVARRRLRHRHRAPGRRRPVGGARHPCAERHDAGIAAASPTATLDARRAFRDPPAPGPGEVEIAIKAVGLNHLDVWGFRGMAFAKRTFPLTRRRRGCRRDRCARRRPTAAFRPGDPRRDVRRADLRHLPGLPGGARQSLRERRRA